MRFVCGTVVGIIFGLAVGVGAQGYHYFAGGADLHGYSQQRQMAYVAGVFDTVEQMVALTEASDSPGTYIARLYQCLDNRGDDLVALTDWAQRQYAFHTQRSPAASYILTHACDQP